MLFGKSKKVKISKDNTPRNKRFEALCLKSQSELKRWLKEYFKGKGKTIYDNGKFLFVDGTAPVLLTAHLDTVHKELPKEIVYKNGTISSPQGIGGDDRCGVYMILEILKEIDCPVVFCEDEETGGYGSEDFAETELCRSLGNRISYVIDLDRMNSHDAVYYDLDNPDFEEFVEKEFWKFSYGSFTDICNLCPTIGVAGVNLSCGYYKQHTTNEYVVLDEMEKCIKEAKLLIKRSSKDQKFEYIEYKKVGKSKLYDDAWDYYYNSKYSATDYFYIKFYGGKGEEVDFLDAVSDMEAVGYFLMDHPALTYNDIIEVGYESEYEWPDGGGSGYTT